MVRFRHGEMLAVVLATAMAGAQTHINGIHPGTGSAGKTEIRVLQFALSGSNCQDRHCILQVTGSNTLVPHPAFRVQGDRLYVRIFHNKLADLTKPRYVHKGECITYSPLRVELSNFGSNEGIVFGAEVQNALSDFARLHGPPTPINTVVLVFESEPADEPEGRYSLLRLKSRDDVEKYFRYAIEVTFSADSDTYNSWKAAYHRNQEAIAQLAPPAGGNQESGSYTDRISTFVKNIFAPKVYAAAAEPTPPTPPNAPAVPVTPEPALYSGQIAVVPPGDCRTIGPYVQLNTTYTVSSLVPVAKLKPNPCGE